MLLELLPKELSPETIIHVGGVTLLLVIVFFETGIFFGFFLPGDSLLFTAGIMCDGPYLSLPPTELIPLLIIAATLGTAAGFFFAVDLSDDRLDRGDHVVGNDRCLAQRLLGEGLHRALYFGAREIRFRLEFFLQQLAKAAGGRGGGDRARGLRIRHDFGHVLNSFGELL